MILQHSNLKRGKKISRVPIPYNILILHSMFFIIYSTSDVSAVSMQEINVLHHFVQTRNNEIHGNQTVTILVCCCFSGPELSHRHPQLVLKENFLNFRHESVFQSNMCNHSMFLVDYFVQYFYPLPPNCCDKKYNICRVGVTFGA